MPEPKAENRYRALIERVMGEFQVSKDAARVRMEQRKILVRNAVPSLFG